MRRLLATLALALLTACSTTSVDAASAGRIRFFQIADSAFDRHTRNPDGDQRAWMRRHYWRMLTYSPYFDSRLAWFRRALVYKDLYAVYASSALATEHPDWILRDAAGNALFIPYDCADGSCPQYAGDPGNPDFRARWIADARALLRTGYRGLFVDDVNMTITRVANGHGQAVAPIDPRRGVAMTEADWREAMATFLEEIRRAFPGVEIVHNSLWFVGQDDPAVQRQLLAADVISLERGVNDAGLRGGNGPFGFDRFLAHVDWLHERRRGVIFEADAGSDAAREYGLAGWLLVSSGRDAIGNGPGGAPDDWWPGYDVVLGPARGARYAWHGVLRRDFARGFVLVNPPQASTRTLQLDAAVVDLADRAVGSVTLGAAQGAVLRFNRTATRRAAQEGAS